MEDGRRIIFHLKYSLLSIISRKQSSPPHHTKAARTHFASDLGLMKLKRYQHFKQNVHDHTINQNDITNSEIDENEILAAKKRLEFVFDQEFCNDI